MAMIAETPAVADPRQLFIIMGAFQRAGAEIEPTILDILRHHQPLFRKQAVKTAHRHTGFAGQPLRAQMFRLNRLID